MANRFFTRQVLGPGPVLLDGDDAHHLGTVRRFVSGEIVTLFNGDGFEYSAVVESVNKRTTMLKVTDRRIAERESKRHVTIASALPKGDRFDFLIEKLVELGCSKLIPLMTKRSVVKPSEEKREKWERAVIEASKQCGRNRLMTISAPQRFDSWITTVSGVRYLLHTDEEQLFPRILSTEPITVAIGPEGGWSEAEIKAAIDASWSIASLGTRTLRIESAALVATTLAVNS
jgi:16S rRNA (uracil1498-N3)-methyltransferase